jgi:hypothetical protein
MATFPCHTVDRLMWMFRGVEEEFVVSTLTRIMCMMVWRRLDLVGFGKGTARVTALFDLEVKKIPE